MQNTINANGVFTLRRAEESDKEIIWKILQEAILKRKKEGSNQWQDGYPNVETVTNDIHDKIGFVLEFAGKITAYTALIFDKEPAYENPDVTWLTNGKYAVIHRVAVSQSFAGQGIAKIFFKKLEQRVKEEQIFSIKVDTNFDNIAMLKILESLDYKYCGEVYLRGNARKAFEKTLI